MGKHLPVVSGDRLVRALQRAGWTIARQRGSHVRLQRASVLISVPIHAGRALPPGTLAAILSDADLTPDDLRNLL
jgi:predicted RNA binding protein YcfA (HicA-like mRNA interferase family)